MKQYNNNRGRTFWDLIAEHPKMTFIIMILLLITIVFLGFNNYSIKSSVLTLEPGKSSSTKAIPKEDTIRSKPNELDTSVSIRKQSTSTLKVKSVKEKTVSKQPQKDTIKTEIVNVTSHNQSGGITANQVNIGAIPRKLDLNIKNQLLTFLQNKSEKIDITSLLGDSESFQFANEINEFLKSQGFTKIEGVSQSAFSQPVIGQFINRDSSGVKIIIGAKPYQ